MAKFVQALGVLFGIGAAAGYLTGGGPHAYDIEFVIKNGILTAEKKQNPPHKVPKTHSTIWTFTNSAGADVIFEFYDAKPAPCRFEFTPPGNTRPCGSSLVTVKTGPGQRAQVVAHTHRDWDGKDCVKVSCPGIIEARLVTDSSFHKVDPDLQIERDNLLNQLRALLAALAAVCVVGPPLNTYIKRRRAAGGK